MNSYLQELSNIYGIQPHPEKSQDVGLKFFKNLFYNL